MWSVYSLGILLSLWFYHWQHRQPFNGIYRGQPGWAGTRTPRNINPVDHLHCPQIPHKHSQPSLPVYLWSLILRRTQGNSWKKLEEPEDKNPHFLCTRLILDLTRLLLKRWSPLTHASHFVTASWPGAATQTETLLSTVIFKIIMAPLHRRRFVDVHLYLRFSVDPTIFPWKQIYYTKNYHFWRFGAGKPTFKSQNGEIWRKGANLGVTHRSKFCKNRLRDILFGANLYQKLPIFCYFLGSKPTFLKPKECNFETLSPSHIL